MSHTGFVSRFVKRFYDIFKIYKPHSSGFTTGRFPHGCPHSNPAFVFRPLDITSESLSAGSDLTGFSGRVYAPDRASPVLRRTPPTRYCVCLGISSSVAKKTVPIVFFSPYVFRATCGTPLFPVTALPADRPPRYVQNDISMYFLVDTTVSVTVV